MKKTLILVLLTIPSISISQSTKALEGFWGIKWGTSAAQMKKEMLQKQGVTLDAKNSKDGSMFFDNGKWGAFRVVFSIFQYGERGVHTAKALLSPTVEAKVIDLYDDVVSSLTEKYGDPKNEIKDFKPPYRDGDGYETQAIKYGKGTYSTYWGIPSAKGDEDAIVVEITEGLEVRVTYQNTDMFNTANEKTKKVLQSDY